MLAVWGVCHNWNLTFKLAMICRYKATITPVIKHIQRVLPEMQRFSSLCDSNAQVTLEHQDLDLLPLSELQKVDHWLEGVVDDFAKAACESVSQLSCLRAHLQYVLHIIALLLM